MARPGVTYFDVAQAANALQEANEYPTIDRIRQRLGTGSNTTIASHLKQWKVEHMPTVSEIPKTTLPQPLLIQLQAFWDELRLSSSREFDKEREEHQAAMEALKEKSSDQAAELQDSQQVVSKQQKYIDELEKKSETLENLLKSQKTDNVELESKIKCQEEAVKNKQEMISTLQEQLKNVTRSLEHFHVAAQKQRDEDDLKHASQINQLEQTIHQLKQNIEVSNERYRQLTIEHEHNGFRVKQLTLETDQTKSQLVRKIEEAATYKAKLDESKALATGFQTTIEDQKQSNVLLQNKLTSLLLELRDLEHNNHLTESNLATKNEKIAALTNERDKAQLENEILTHQLDALLLK